MDLTERQKQIRARMEYRASARHEVLRKAAGLRDAVQAFLIGNAGEEVLRYAKNEYDAAVSELQRRNNEPD